MGLFVDNVYGVGILVWVSPSISWEVDVAVVGEDDSKVFQSDQVVFLSLDKFVRDLDKNSRLKLTVLLGPGVNIVGLVLVDRVDLYSDSSIST